MNVPQVFAKLGRRTPRLPKSSGLKHWVASLIGTSSAQSLTQYLRHLTWIWMGPVFLLAVALAGALIFMVHRQEQAELAVWAEHIRQEIDHDFEQRQHGLKSIAALTLSPERPIDLQRWYAHARAYDLVFGTPVILANEQRRILFNTRVPLTEPLADLPKPPGPSTFMTALVSGEPQVGDVVTAPVLGQKVVTVVVPVEQHYALLGLVVLPKVERLLEAQLLPKGWDVAVYDRAGSTVATTNEASIQWTGAPSSRRFLAKTTSAQWTVIVQASAWSFYRPHILAAVGLVLLISLIIGGTTMATGRAASGLLASVRRLGNSAKPLGVDDATPIRRQVPHIEEIEAARIELQRLQNAQFQAEEAERARIAGELHDGLQQDAAAAIVNLELLKSQLDPAKGPNKSMSVCLEAIRKIITGLARAVGELRPASVAPGGLVAALEQTVKQFTDITGIHVEFEVVGEEDKVAHFSSPVADGLFRVAQECLNNVRKHSQATFAHIELDVTKPAQVRLTVMDDGVGLGAPPAASSGGFGMQSMVQRVNSLSGTLAVWRGHDQSPDRGTTVIATVPILSSR